MPAPESHPERIRGFRPLARARRLVLSWAGLLVLVVSTGGPRAARADAAPTEAVLYLAELSLDGRLLDGELPLYELDGRRYLAFQAFLRAVEFPIEREGERWSGWWISPESRFDWESTGIGPPIRLDTPDGPAVGLEQLERWFGLELDFDPRRQRLRLRSERPLPVEQRDERASRRARGLSAGEPGPAVEVRDRYAMIGVPVLDVSVHARLDGGDGREIGDSQSVSVDLGMDLARHSVLYDGSWSRSNDHAGEVRNRLTFERHAATATGTLGLGVTGYSFGDVFTTGLNLVDGGGSGVGLVVERRRRPGRDAGLSTVLLTGDAPPGWDVELLRNGRLVAFGVVGPDGRWSFDDIETVRGENRFVARLYGPQGQLEEQEQLVWGGGSELPEGDFEFRFAHVDHSRRLLDGSLDDGRFVPAGAVTDLRGSYALTDDLQLGLAWSQAEVAGRGDTKRLEAHDYASVFGRWSLGRGALLGEFVDQLDAGSAWRLEYVGTWKGQDYRLSHEAREDFESPRSRREAPVRSRTRISFSGALPWKGFEQYLVRASFERLPEGPEVLRLFARLFGRLGPAAVTNDLEWTHDSAGGDDRLDGRLRVTGRWKRVQVGAALDYALLGDDPFRQLSATLRWRPGPRVYSAFTLRGDLAGDGDVWLESLLSARRRGIDYTLRGAVSSAGDWSVGVNVLLHLGRSVPGGSWLADTSSAARSGRLVLAPFLDRDGDGRRDDDEPSVLDATWKGEGAKGTEPGLLVAGFVPAGQPFDIDLAHLDLPDPFLVPAAERYQVWTHAGGLLRVDVPVLETVDLGGWLTLAADDPAGFDALAVSVRSGGRTLATVRPEADGYFLVERLPAGEHSLVVRELSGGAELARRPLSLSADEGFLLMEPLRVARRHEAPTAFEPPVSVAQRGAARDDDDLLPPTSDPARPSASGPRAGQ